MKHRVLFAGLCLLSCCSSVFFANSEEIVLSGISAQDSFRQGREMYFHQDFDRAEKYFRECVNLDRKNPEYLCWLAQSIAYAIAEEAKQGASKLSLLPDGKEIRQLYLDALELDPQSEKARIGYAIILRDIPKLLGGDVSKAREMLLGVIEDNPNNIQARHSLGLLYIRKEKKYEEGLQWLLSVAEQKEQRDFSEEEEMALANTYHAIGKTYIENFSQPQKALDFMMKSYRLNATSVVTLLDLVEIYQSLGQKKEAADRLREAAGIVKERKYTYFNGDVKKAAKKLRMKEDLNL